MLTSGKLNGYVADIEEQAQERFERLVEQMKQAQCITEQLKVENALEWVGRMNNIQAFSYTHLPADPISFQYSKHDGEEQIISNE